MKSSLLGVALLLAAAAALSLSCQSEPEEDCNPGSVGCECSAGQCLPGLACVSGVCVQSSPTTTDTTNETSSETEATSASESETETDDVDSSGRASASADTTDTGVTGCQGTDGTIDCPCLAGDACLGDLTCDGSQTCICLSGTACGESDCVEDFQTDDRHCGSCGNACATFQGIGACTGGACPPTLSECVPSNTVTTCEAVCTAQGRTCVAQGCGPDNFSWFQFGNEVACDEFSQKGGGFEACTDDLSPLLDQEYMRCCCTP